MTDEDMITIETLINRCNGCRFVACEQCEINWTQIKSIEKMWYKYTNIVNNLENLLKELEKEGDFVYDKFMNENTDWLNWGGMLQEIGYIEGEIRGYLNEGNKGNS